MCRLPRYHVKNRVQVKDKRNTPITQDTRTRETRDCAKVLLKRFEDDFLHSDQLIDQEPNRRFAILHDHDDTLCRLFIPGLAIEMTRLDTVP